MDIRAIRKDFPFLEREIDGKPIIYCDNASTTQKPRMVLDRMHEFSINASANVHRGIYEIAERATTAYENARTSVAHFINAHPREIVFTRGTTEGINGIARSWAHEHIQQGDEIVVTELEHHSNFIPWQQIVIEKGAHLRVVPINQDGTLQMAQLDKFITSKTKLIALTHMSHVIGISPDVAAFVSAGRAVGSKILIDVAQSVAHKPIDVQALDADFLVFSGHKMFGPTGIGVLYIRESLHDQVPPFQFGGGMVFDVTFNETTFLQPPYKYEAGTPAIAQAVGLSYAIDYYRQTIDWKKLHRHETSLVSQLLESLVRMPRVQVLGPLEQLAHNGHLVSFVVEGMHSHDVAAYLAQYGVCVRAGNHCAQPLARKLGITASVRVSFSAYNTLQEVDVIHHALTAMLKV